MSIVIVLIAFIVVVTSMIATGYYFHNRGFNEGYNFGMRAAYDAAFHIKKTKAERVECRRSEYDSTCNKYKCDHRIGNGGCITGDDPEVCKPYIEDVLHEKEIQPC